MLIVHLLMTRITEFTERSSARPPAQEPSGSSQDDQIFLAGLSSRRAGIGTSGVGAAETEESVALGRTGKRERWGSRRSLTPDNVSLGAMGMRIKPYNVA